MTTYYVHLQYDWNTYLIGSVWNGVSSSTNYWLQYALTTNSASPWAASLYQFSSGDSLYFKIWDRTSWPSGTLPPAVEGGIGLNSLDGATIYGSSAGLVDPGTSSQTNLAWGTVNNKSCIEFQNIGMSSPQPPPESPWGPCMFASNTVLGPLTILTPSSDPFSFKLNFRLNVTTNTTRAFISDPETRIGSGIKT